MIRKQDADRPAAKSAGLLRRLLPVVLGLAILAAGVNVYWWLSRPALEPLPSVATENLEPPIRKLIQGATAEVASKTHSSAAWGDLGAVFFVHDLRAEAEVCFRNAERLDPADYRWPYLQGASRSFSDADEALVCYWRAVKRSGQRPAVQLRLIELLLDRGELEAAAEQIESVLSYAPSDPRGQLAKARLLFAQGHLEEAKSWAQRSAEAAADKRATHLLLAQLCRRLQDAKGEASAMAALEQIPDGFTHWADPDIAAIVVLRQDRATRMSRAENLADSGEMAKASQMLSDLATGNDGATAAAQLALKHNQEGRFGEAEALLRKQLLVSPHDERLHFQLGSACFQQERHHEAQSEFLRVIELKPDYVDAWYNLGLARLKLGKPADAREAFAATVRLSPSRVYARINLAELLLEEGEYEQAREHLEVAVKLAPQEKHAQELLIRAKTAPK